VTGAPKIQAMRVIAELEASGREAYTGAVGYASPLAGLELNVAIRTLEISGDRIWLGVGGGIVADSDPRRELEECLVKARPVVAAAGGRVRAPDAPAPRSAVAGPQRALDGAADRPDPALGVFSTVLVRDARAVYLDAHVERLRASVEQLYGQALPGGIERRLADAVAGCELGRLRLIAAPADGGVAAVEVACEPWTAPADAEPVALVPFALPGGLGAHKWRDRRLLAELERRGGGVPLIVDLDGELLEAAHANVWIVEDAALVTPPLDGRLLPGVMRDRIPAAAADAGLDVREEPLTLARVAAADELLLTSSLRGVHPARCAGAGGSFSAGARLQAALSGERGPDRVKLSAL
jgi:para-aminobenzoate synthetase/4-amino-4-deoxychorismate lyase